MDKMQIVARCMRRAKYAAKGELGSLKHDAMSWARYSGTDTDGMFKMYDEAQEVLDDCLAEATRYLENL